MYAPKIFSISALTLTALLLTACVSGKPQGDTYTSPRTGTTTKIESDREMCIRSCNDQYSRCNDMLVSTRSDVSSLRQPQIFGVGSDCKDALNACLPKCNARN